jgi:hypothetical protein
MSTDKDFYYKYIKYKSKYVGLKGGLDKEQSRKLSRSTSYKNVCDVLSRSKYTDKERAEKKKKVYDTLLKDVFKEKNFTKLKDKHVKETFKVLDKVYFDNYLSTSLRERGHTLSFKASYKLTSSAGICKYRYSYRNNIITDASFQLILSAKIIEDIFNNKEKSLKIGGLLCTDRLDCYLNIFEHELTHLVVNMFCPDEGKEMGGHTTTFKSITNNMYGHTEYKHSLLMGDAETVDKHIAYFKNNVEIDDIVEAENCKGTFFRGIVYGISSKSVSVVNERDNKRYTLPYFMLKKLIKHTGSKMKVGEKKKKPVELDKLKKGMTIQINFKGKIVDAEVVNTGSKRVRVKLENGKEWYIPPNWIV